MVNNKGDYDMFQRLIKEKEDKKIYDTLHKNGIMEISKGIFSKCYKINNFDFIFTNTKEKELIYNQYTDLLTAFGPELHVQLNIYNRKINKEEKKKELYFPVMLDDMSPYRKQYNNWISANIDKEKQFQREIYLILTMEEESIEKAFCKYQKIDDLIDLFLKKMTCNNVRPLIKEEWEEFLLDITGNNKKTINLNTQKETTIYTRTEKIGNKCIKHFSFKNLIKNLDYNIINEIMEIDAERMVSLHFKSTNEHQKKPLMKESNYTSTDYILFDRALCSSVVTLFAEDELELKNQISNLKCEHLKQINKVDLTKILPIGVINSTTNRPISLNEARKLIPFSYMDPIQEKGGLCYGIHPLLGTSIILNRRMHKNRNGIILGNLGSGKTEIMKNEIKQVLLKTEDDVTIIDPWNEYSEIAEVFHGDIIRLGPDMDWHINPLDLHVDSNNFTDSLALQCDFITALYESTLGTNCRLSINEKSMIDRCVRILYKPYLIHMEELHKEDPGITCDVTASPTLKELRKILSDQSEEEGKKIAVGFEKLHFFDHKTNVKHKNKLTIYQSSCFQGDFTVSIMLTYLKAFWNHILTESHIAKYKWLYMDEIYPLMKSDFLTFYLSQIYKRGGVHWCIPTCATAYPNELLKSPIAASILNNCGTIMLLSQSKDTTKLYSELLDIPESLNPYITNVGPGQGLLYTGCSIVPFKQDRIININREHY